MENHPIPQDVTGFQFKLIGNMTVKQFAYVAAGVVSAAILYYLPGGSLMLVIKIILIPFSLLSGVALAFLPFEGRPIDTMFMHFFKALFSPNQFLYSKTGKSLAYAFSVSSKQYIAPQPLGPQQQTQEALRLTKLQQMLSTSTSSLQNNKYDAKELHYAQLLGGVPAGASVPQAPSVPPPPPIVEQSTPPAAASAEPVQPSQLITPPPQMITVPITPAQIPIPNKPELSNDSLVKDVDTPEPLVQTVAPAVFDHTLAPSSHEVGSGRSDSEESSDSKSSARQLEELAKQKAQLEQQLHTLNQQMTNAPVPSTPAPTQHVPPPPVEPVMPAVKPSVTELPAQAPKTRGVTLPHDKKAAGMTNVLNSPNLIAGIIKDARGNVLTNILVEIKDKDGNPVRAFKTNGLGQFVSATPLAQGVYTIEFEDPKKQQSFDIIEVTANGNIIPPIEVISHDARAALAKELFAS